MSPKRREPSRSSIWEKSGRRIADRGGHTGEDGLEYLEEYFSEPAGELFLQMTVEIREKKIEDHFRARNGG